MKSKIIYISGNDVFDVADIRAAFDEVRDSLGLPTDTILFGVTVDSDAAAVTAEEKQEKAIPILSVLSGKSEEKPAEVEVKEEIPETEPTPAPITQEVVEPVTIVDIMTDEVPLAEEEKTLEKLFESIAPLREDNIAPTVSVSLTEPEQDTESVSDATLEQLATEFAEKEDDIVTTPKTQAAGKIGKLKNILPFKKAKRDDAGLMGDLFGWAGIAANDDEFSIPGFFTTAATKK